MKNKLAKLIDLKSIITILLVVTLVVLVVANLPINDEGIKSLFISVTSSCFTYYFAKKKSNSEGE
jgi:hypothetical protein